VWSFVLTAVCLTLAVSHRAPAQDAPQEVAAEKHPLPKYLNTENGVAYVGDQVCGSCHSFEYKRFKQTAMGRSASVPSADDLKSLAKPITFSSDTLNRTYTVYARNGKMYHEESESDADGQLVFSETHEIALYDRRRRGRQELSGGQGRCLLRLTDFFLHAHKRMGSFAGI
jgi:hypothetical protein